MCGLCSSGDEAVPAGLRLVQSIKAGLVSRAPRMVAWDNWENFCSGRSSVKLNYMELQTGLN